MRSHGVAPRGLSSRVTQSSLHEGRFGRMFRRLPAAPPLPGRELTALARNMRGRASGTADNPAIPAGYTYFGQFVDHDITFDPQSRLERENDPDALVDFRTPRFDLDSVYGSGPDDEPFQYARGTQGMRMLIESNGRGDDDLPRNSEGVALIGDPRNDENTIVGQLHLLFLKFHNKVAEQVAADRRIADSDRFEETRRRVRWTYQRIVVDDYLPRVCGPEAVDRVWRVDAHTGERTISTRFYKPTTRPYMPVEFSGAAFRFGHSQVRDAYEVSDQAGTRPIFVPGPLADPLQDLRGFRRLPPHWSVDWSRFFVVGGSAPQPGRAIDAKLSPALFDLPDSGGSLAVRNLQRGEALGLPSGQAVAAAADLPNVLSGAELGAPEPTPLWFYVLKESELVTGGRHLGPVGALIVTEVLLGLLRGDPQSFFSREPGWQATAVVPDADGDGVVGMGDLVAFVLS
jgi:hypothetical protein